MKLHSLLPLGAAAGTAAAAVWLYRENTAIDTEAFPVFLPHLPAPFEGAKIAVVSDVHLPNPAWSPRRLTALVAMQKPDAVFIPGDLTTSYAAFDRDGLTELAQGLAAIAPCFAVVGNHEWNADRVEQYTAILREAGVTVMRDESAWWTRGGDRLHLYGVYRRPDTALPRDPDAPLVALAHLPHYLDDYARAGWDLVVTGHAHGGQIRLFGQGLYAPGQGTLPQKTSGLYRKGDTTMLVSRGLGNSSFGFRLGNRLHLPVLILFRKPDA